jgi:hypothetical protein
MKKIPSIVESTNSYEAWMADEIDIVPGDLERKHELMAGDDKGTFYRATYYRRAQVLPVLLPELMAYTVVLSMADAHAGQYAVWLNANDEEVLGGNDFDEAYPLAWTNDLINQATSLLIKKEEGSLILKVEDACESLLKGYGRCLEVGPAPLILQEQHHALRRIVEEQKIKPEKYWDKLLQSPEIDIPHKLLELLKNELPAGITDYKTLARTAGKGSLGRRRIDMIAPLDDGYIAEEAKALMPSACAWAATGRARRVTQMYEEQILSLPTRSPDPSVKIVDGWLLRKLSPAYRHIELAKIYDKDDQDIFLRAMGFDHANTHLGTPNSKRSIYRQFEQLDGKRLLHAAETMLAKVNSDWDDWKQHWSEQAESR